MGTLDDWLSYIYPSNASAPTPERGPGESAGGIGLDLVGNAIGGLGSMAKRAFQSSDAMQKGYGYDPAPAVNAAMLTMGGGAFGAPMRAGEAALGAGPIRGYHGSPYDFDRFDMSKIGSGEGAQAYGHGLYIAENPETAQQYKNAVQRRVPITPDEAKRFAETKTPIQQGRMYEVGINADPEHFLDWDKPLSEQPELFNKLKQSGIINDKSPTYQKTGQASPSALVQMPVEPGSMEQKIRSAGIPGIKYLDQGSRGAGEGTRNYVVFDDSIIDILRKYGLVGTLGSGITAYDAKRNANK